MIAITGTGAVSPAGWGAGALLAAVRDGVRPQPVALERQSDRGTVSTPVLRVPAEGSTVPKFARLRRASPISKFAAAAVAEALGDERLAAIAAGSLRTGVVFTLTNGCVNYSNRFFAEAVADPAMASPILFPETVFNAPSSHLSAMMGSTAPNDTLIADSSGFFSGIDLAIEWLGRGEVDACVVVAAEEIDWLSAEGLRYYSRGYVAAEGAAAVVVERAAGPVTVLELPDPVSLASHSRQQAAAAIRAALDAGDDGQTLLVDGCAGEDRFDRPETRAWHDWAGPRWSPRTVLGEAMGVSSAFQVVAAAEALKAGLCRRALVTACGANQQAAGMTLGQTGLDGRGIER